MAISPINMNVSRLPLGSQLIHLSDRYLLYVFVCLRLGRPGLTDNELCAMFGASFEPEIKLDVDWWPCFLKRCQENRRRLKQGNIILTGHMTERDLLEGIRETTDSQTFRKPGSETQHATLVGTLLQRIQRGTGPLPQRGL